MCGIAGAFSIDDCSVLPLTLPVLDRMTDAMTHRGPDDRGTCIVPGAALGVRRLSIVDVAAGHQPVANEDDRILAVQNGELFNHADLRPALVRAGHRLRTRCDTEVIPHLYESHGDEFMRDLRGMFAIAVWDAHRRRGLLVRDRLGIKPLYYARCGGLLVFASELKALLASGLVEARLDLESLELFLTFGYVPAPRTLLQDVFKLSPGHRLVVERGQVREERYWRYPQVAGVDRKADVDEQAAVVLESLRESVRLRLMSDVPLGAMLSGGLDSSLIVALMAEELDTPVQTFAVGFAGSPTNELADAREVAELVGAEHHELELADASTNLEELVWRLDEPLADLSSLGFLALSRLARQHVTVALSGQGADELFGGYRHYLHAQAARSWARVPRALGAPLLGLAARAPGALPRASAALKASSAPERALHAKRIASDSDVAALLPGASGGAAVRALAAVHDPATTDPVAAALSIDAQLALPDDMLHYFDRASMAESLEVRVPFLDHVFVETVARMPVNLKLRGTTTKHVLRVAARGLVPDRIIDKPKIGFFNASVGDWVAGSLEHDLRNVLLDERPRYSEAISRAAVERLVETQQRAPTSQRAHLLLALMMLETWLGSYMATAQPVPEREAALA